MVFRQGMRLTVGGLAVGLIATLFLSQTLGAFLYGIEPHDPATLLTVSAVLILVSAAACLVPAHRATTVDPVTVLKVE